MRKCLKCLNVTKEITENCKICGLRHDAGSFVTVYPPRARRKVITARPKGNSGLSMARVFEEAMAC